MQLHFTRHKESTGSPSCRSACGGRGCAVQWRDEHSCACSAGPWKGCRCLELSSRLPGWEAKLDDQQQLLPSPVKPA